VIDIASERRIRNVRIRLMIATGIMMVSLACIDARAQGTSDRPRFEIGGQFVSLRLNDFDEIAAGIGGRFAYDINDHLAIETVVNHFIANPSGNFGETVGLAGIRVGSRIERFGVFAKLRAGAINLGGGDFDLRIKQKTFFAAEAGMAIEYYAGPHMILRLDLGDLVVPFGGASFLSTIPPKKLGTSHNLQTEIGIAVRF
jgi:hypothetical protein